MKKIQFFFLLFLLLMTGSCSDQRVQMAWLAEMNKSDGEESAGSV